MTTPTEKAPDRGAASPMTPDRWREVESVLRAALACDAGQRAAVVADACGDDAELRREVESLLAAHDDAGDEFLERPAIAPFGETATPRPLGERLASVLAGQYEIERELGRGGMAIVFLARDMRHDRRVAIKVLREDVAAAVGAERFLEEIRVTASLQHPHILPLFDSGSEAGLLWYVMPFVEGETLRERLARERRLPVDVSLRLVREMADALEHAHRRGLVHRDVKPENVLVHDGHALIADFGIALALEEAGGERLTRTGITIGTPQYMAPEQAAGERAIDARADVYALGAVLHEMLSGESPFAAGSPAAVLWRVRNEPATALAMHRVDVAPFLDAAVRRALAKQPDDRFPSAAAFAAALDGPAANARAIDALGSTDDESARGRVVSARAAVYAAIGMLVIGLAGGWALARLPFARPGRVPAPEAATPSTDIATSRGQMPARDDDLTLAVVDRAGRPLRTIAADRPWTPRISPDGRRVAYGAFGSGRRTSDLWVTDLAGGPVQRVTDDDADSNDPQWSADGKTLVFSASDPDGKDLLLRKIGGSEARVLAARAGTQFASDWLRDGSALLVTDNTGRNQHDIIVQPADGSRGWPYVATTADETAARLSPNGTWVAYTSDVSGRPEVYLNSFPRPGQRVKVSSGGGLHPVWRADGRELYYWSHGALIAVPIGASRGETPPEIGAPAVLFRAPYYIGPNTMYDVSPDGQRFVIVRSR
jgi:serine/threonine-protein kinase